MPDSSLTPSTQHRFTQARRHAAVPATCLFTSKSSCRRERSIQLDVRGGCGTCFWWLLFLIFLPLFHEHDHRLFSPFFVGSPKAPLQDAHEVLWSIIMSHNAPGLSVPKNIWVWDKIPLSYWFKNKRLPAAVCKRWERLTGDDTLWKRLDLGLASVPAGACWVIMHIFSIAL